MRSAGGRFGIGTDSNVLIDPAGELRALEYAQRLTKRARNVLAPEAGRSTGRALFDAALAGGSQALGLDAPRLAQGDPADFISLKAEDAALIGRHGDAILDSWIFAGGQVDCVWRRGRKLVENGRHFDRARIRARYRRAVESVLE